MLDLCRVLSPVPRRAIIYMLRSTLNAVIVLSVMQFAECQFNQNMQLFDDFEVQMCRERWHRLDWKQILQPCIGRTIFGHNKLPSTLRTNPNWSKLLSMDIKNAGEYSKIVIQTVDQIGRLKTIGGDSWRIMITGPSSLQPIVHDMNNGQYEIAFLLLEPGFYKADIFLEGTLCSQFVDPPKDWFKKGDYNGHFQVAHMYKTNPGWKQMLEKRLWERLGGNNSIVQFQINPMDQLRFAANQAKLDQWKKICNIPDRCSYLWDGFGRWVGQEWKPYKVQERISEQPTLSVLQGGRRRKPGILWFYGDCFSFHFYELERNQTLCKNVFKKCGNSYNWVYPRLNPDPKLDVSIHRKDSSEISIKKLLHSLRKVLRRSDMDKDSAIVLNFGLHFTRSTTFENYQKLILGVMKELDSYKGQAAWRSTTSVWKQELKVHKRFQTNQRVQLFNAFAASTLCYAGYPVLDVFPMTASTSYQPQDGIHYENWITKPIEQVLINYFKDGVLS